MIFFSKFKKSPLSATNTQGVFIEDTKTLQTSVFILYRFYKNVNFHVIPVSLKKI